MSRQRRKVFVDANNHDRWIVSYADFITLLFAFFVVMYSISSVNQGKYQSLTQSLDTAFSNREHKTPHQDTVQSAPENKQVWEVTSGSFNETSPVLPSLPMLTESGETFDIKAYMATMEAKKRETTESIQPDVSLEPASKDSEPTPEPDLEKRRELSDEILKEREQLKQTSNQLEQALGSYVDEKMISVKRNDYWIELEMNSELLFLSGEADLSKKAPPVLKEIAEVINNVPNAINVEGHTDNVPISTIKFRSNWDLSSARASSVVQALVEAGIDPMRFSAVGYGEFHPIGDNNTQEGRFKNRRVTLVLMSQAFSRYGANDEERAKLLNLKTTTD